jgi:photosystem II stability/assembly factor-like uncharacterized protein
MKKIFLIILFLLNINIFAQVWKTQNSGVKSTLFSVSFVDTLNGWAVGDSSVIIRTSNGGINWSEQSCPIKSVLLRKVQFISKNVGFISGFNGSFFSTVDGGVNWNANSIMYDSSGFYYDDLCFINENEGWIPGRKEGYNYGIGLILHTTNGGKSWEKQIEISSSDQFSKIYFTAIKFQDNKVGWALGGDFTDNFSEVFVYKTLNSGSTWDKIGLIPFPNGILRIAGKDSLWSGETNLVTSFNGGNNWSYYSSELNDAMLISPESGLRGWIYYSDINSNEKRILFTNNAGQTWKEENSWNGGAFVLDMTNVSGYVWIVGTNGLIMKRNPTITTIIKKQNEIPKEIRLYPNFPNPFNPSTTISYDLSSESRVELNIYDITGKTVKSFFCGFQNAGNHKIIWDGKNNYGENLSSGIYLSNFKAITILGNIISIYSKLVLLK